MWGRRPPANLNRVPYYVVVQSEPQFILLLLRERFNTGNGGITPCLLPRLPSRRRHGTRQHRWRVCLLRSFGILRAGGQDSSAAAAAALTGSPAARPSAVKQAPHSCKRPPGSYAGRVFPLRGAHCSDGREQRNGLPRTVARYHDQEVIASTRSAMGEASVSGIGDSSQMSQMLRQWQCRRRAKSASLPTPPPRINLGQKLGWGPQGDTRRPLPVR